MSLLDVFKANPDELLFPFLCKALQLCTCNGNPCPWTHNFTEAFNPHVACVGVRASSTWLKATLTSKQEHTVPTLFSMDLFVFWVFCFISNSWISFRFYVEFYLLFKSLSWTSSSSNISQVGLSCPSRGVKAQDVLDAKPDFHPSAPLPNRSTKHGDYCPLEKEFPCPPRKLSPKGCEGEENSWPPGAWILSPSTATSCLKTLGKSPPLSVSGCSLGKMKARD